MEFYMRAVQQRIQWFTLAAIISMLSLPGNAQEAATTPSGPVQNAILEGIQITTEKGAAPDEKIVTCYMIFRDKPSSYFYDPDPKSKKIAFEFNDTEKGSSPVPSQGEPPIKGFSVEQKKINVNAQVQGLKPEWHDLTVVTFALDAMPKISVTDQYNIISFTYKWTTDPAKLSQYIEAKKRNILIPISLATVGGGGLGAALYFLLKPEEGEKPLEPLSTDDLPKHEPVLFP
jgi:hypothetical protein